MTVSSKLYGVAAAIGVMVASSMPAMAQDVGAQEAVAEVNTGDTAWMMTSTVLVLLMILPGLALFYGGLTRSKNMLSTMTQVGGAAALAMLVWIGWGYATAFGPNGNSLFAWGNYFLSDVTPDSVSGTIPEYVFVAFQMTFAAITAALVLGGVVERLKFSAALVFTLFWLTIVYFPIAHMVWAEGGLFFDMDALDFAGGTVVHINAGVSALVAAVLLGKRMGYPREPMPPHSLTLTMVGTGLLWVGWFGFNAGSALGANGTAGLAMINTFVATAAGALSWMLTEKLAGHKPSALGLSSGIIAGLVAITPAAGNSGPLGAIVLGAIAAPICFLAVSKIKPALGYDDSLDAFGIHGVGGIVGAVGTAIVYAPGLGGPGDAGYAMGTQIMTQIATVVATIIWATIGTVIAVFIAKALTGLRVTKEVEQEGLDLGEHGERAYN